MQHVKETTDNSTINDSGGHTGANNNSMTTMGQTLWEAQRPINSIVMPRDTLVMGHWNIHACAGQERQRRWPERWKDTNWTYWGLASTEVPGVASAHPISEEVRRKRWCWIGHVLRKELNNDCAVALS